MKGKVKTVRKADSVEGYIKSIEKELAALDSLVEKEKEFLPDKIEQAIKKILKEEFKAGRFNAFIAQDLFAAYVEAGGRKLLVKELKQNPKSVLNLLKLIVEISNVENKQPTQATQININIEGLK